MAEANYGHYPLKRQNYEATIICTVFNDKYEFEDNLLLGVVHSPLEAKALLMQDIFRVMEDFGHDKCEIENSRSAYDEQITIVHTYDDTVRHHWHYYCLFKDPQKESEE
jgi:hypothetical protein